MEQDIVKIIIILLLEIGVIIMVGNWLRKTRQIIEDTNKKLDKLIELKDKKE